MSGKVFKRRNLTKINHIGGMTFDWPSGLSGWPIVVQESKIQNKTFDLNFLKQERFVFQPWIWCFQYKRRGENELLWLALHSHIRQKGKGKGERLRDGGHLSCQTQDKIRPKTFSALPDRHPFEAKKDKTQIWDGHWTICFWCAYMILRPKKETSLRERSLYMKP